MLVTVPCGHAGNNPLYLQDLEEQKRTKYKKQSTVMGNGWVTIGTGTT